jgi:hypothetical protein
MSSNGQRKSNNINSTAIAACASASHLPSGNKNGAGWLWVSFVLANEMGILEGCLALLKEQGWEPKDANLARKLSLGAQDAFTKAQVPLMDAHKIVLRIHNIVGVPFSEDRALWANVKRDLQFKEFMVRHLK